MKKNYLLLFGLVIMCLQLSAQVPTYVATSGLLAWYPFNNSAVDAYSGYNNGVIYGGVSYGTDRFGASLSCYVGNGASGIDIPVNNFPSGNATRSVAAWYKQPLPAPSSLRQIFATGNNSGWGSRFGLTIDNATNRIGWESTGIGRLTTVVPDSAWHHIVVTYPSTGGGSAAIKVYRDGVLVTAATVGGTIASFATVTEPMHHIGSLFMPVSMGSWLYSWIGSLDDIGVWNREITACEVSYLYYGGNPSLAFVGGPTQTLTVCQNSGPTSINSLLSINELNVGITNTWSTLMPPVHGTLVSGYTITSTGSPITPTGLTYTPATGYVGSDSFSVIVQDCNNTYDTTVVYVNVISTASPVSLSGPTTVCSGSTISLTAMPAGGTWTATNSTATVAGGIVTGVTAGMDTIIYSLGGSCGTSSDSQVITIYATPSAPVVSGSVTFCQYAPYVPPSVSGSGILWYTSATGGIGSSSAPVISTTTTGTYNYWVSQTSGSCESARTPVTITVIAQPTPPVIVASPSVYCQGQPFVPFTISSGSGVLWYTSATGGTGSTAMPVLSTSSPGTYTVWASQTIGGCESNRVAVTITVVPSISAGFTYTVRYGCIADTVTFNNTSTSGTLCNWNFGDGTSSTATNPTHIYTTHAPYTVKLMVTGTPCVDSSIQSIDLSHAVTAGFTSSSSSICVGQTITFTNTGSATSPVYYWNFGEGSSSALSSPSHTFTTAGIYSVTQVVTDFVPCSDTVRHTITVDSISSVAIHASDTVICKGTYITFTGETTATQVTWNMGNGDTIQNYNPLVYGFNQAGVYTVSCTAGNNTCPDISVARIITVRPSPYLDLGPDTSVCPGGVPVVLGDYQNAGNADARWLWSTGATGYSINVIEPGEYSVTVDINGCIAKSDVTVGTGCDLAIPNVFTPNGDGLNDYFFPGYILGKNLLKFKISIYNRWGQLVYTSTQINSNGWDGNFNDTPQPQGVFAYIIDVTFMDGESKHYQGNVTLLH